jgi:hypothetical protein
MTDKPSRPSLPREMGIGGSGFALLSIGAAERERTRAGRPPEHCRAGHETFVDECAIARDQAATWLRRRCCLGRFGPELNFNLAPGTTLLDPLDPLTDDRDRFEGRT